MSLQVQNGKNAMPAWSGRLDEDEIQSVSEYVYNQSKNNLWWCCARALTIKFSSPGDNAMQLICMIWWQSWIAYAYVPTHKVLAWCSKMPTCSKRHVFEQICATQSQCNKKLVWKLQPMQSCCIFSMLHTPLSTLAMLHESGQLLPFTKWYFVTCAGSLLSAASYWSVGLCVTLMCIVPSQCAAQCIQSLKRNGCVKAKRKHYNSASPNWMDKSSRSTSVVQTAAADSTGTDPCPCSVLRRSSVLLHSHD